MQLNEPIRKHGSYHFKDRPALPILSETDTKRTVEQNYWPMFTGCFNGVSVIIGIQEEMEALNNMGVFGKGSLSKNFPCFGMKRKGIPPIISSSRWERRVKWINTIQTNLETTKDISDISIPDIQTDKKEETSIDENNISTLNTDKSDCLPSSMTDISIEIDDSDDKSSKEEVVIVDNGVNSSLGKTTAKECDRGGVVVTIEDTDDDKSACSSMNNVNKRPHCDNQVCSADEQTCSGPERKKQKEDRPKSGVEETNNVTYESHSLASTESAVVIVSVDNQDVKSTSERDVEDIDLDIASSSVLGSIKGHISGSAVENEVIVVDKSAVDSEIALEQLNPRIEHEKIKTVLEELHLMLEEAFFLSYGLGCLQVIDVTGQFLSIIGMWNLYRSSQNDFIEKYVAYHHFRSKGWIVKSGIKFGGDFILYKKGPSVHHASYIVFVDLVAPNKEGSNEVSKKTHRTAEIMKSLSRLSENCKKEILVCEVHSPCPMEEITTPALLKKITVNECLMRRWLPAQKRDAD